jgi:hypothetical protein
MLETGDLYDPSQPNEMQLYQDGRAIASSNEARIKDSRVLQIQGCCFDRVKEVGLNFAINNRNDIISGTSWELLKRRVSPAESNTLWRGLVMDVYSRDNGMPDRIGDSEEAQANFTSDIEETLASTAPMRLLDRLRYSLRDKTFCKTTNGGFTWVHGDPKVGDYIFFARRATFRL